MQPTLGALRKPTPDEWDAIMSARASIMHRFRYYVHPLYRYRYVVSDTLDTFASTSGGLIICGSEPLLEWESDVVGFALIHEIGHIRGRHLERGRQFSQRVSNLAGDMEINDDLLKDGVMPARTADQWVLPKTFDAEDGLLMEEYAQHISDFMSHESMKSPGSAGAGDSGTQGDDGSGGTVQIDEGREASSCGGIHSDAAAEGSGEKPLNDAQMKFVDFQFAKDIIASQTSGIGSSHSAPDHLLEWAREKMNPSVDWRKQLKAKMHGAVFSNTKMFMTWKRINRRAENTDIVPGRGSRLPSVLVGIDTSGSMLDSQLYQARADVESICSKVGIRGRNLRVFSVDTEAISDAKGVSTPRSIDIHRGGGTNMSAAFYYAAESRPRPEVFVLITDGMTPWPDEDPAPRMEKIVLLSVPPYDDTHSYTEGIKSRAPEWIRKSFIFMKDPKKQVSAA